MQHEIISRADARERGLKHYFTGKLCPRGHLDLRLASNARCCTCAKEIWQELKKDPVALSRTNANARARYAENSEFRDRKRAMELERYTKESVPRNAVKRRRYREEPDYKARRNEANRNWFKENPDKAHAKSAKRRASKNEALMPDRTYQDLLWEQEIAAEARFLAENTGIEYHVDHIVALNGTDSKGNSVRGPHVWWNLRPITGAENSSKGNRVTQADVRLMFHDLKASGAGPKYIKAVRSQLGTTPPCNWVLPDFAD